MVLREKFNIKGFFYIDGYGCACRKYLEITRKGVEIKSPELMVVMMNPGSSIPLDNNDDGKKLIDAEPDPTQDQIMKVMLQANINYARIINLSDLRNARSEEFYDLIKNKRKDTTHSIFDDSRDDDFDELFICNVPTIFAWGVDNLLRSLAEIAVKKLNVIQPLGILKVGIKYYHANPRFKYKRDLWVAKVVKQLEDLG